MIKKYVKLFVMNILYYMPKSISHKLFYYYRTNKKLNLKNPRDLNEKIQWLIVNKYGKKEGMLADKYAVKKKIDNFDKELNIPSLYGVFKKYEDIDFAKLPDKFVLKTNNGCGNVFICRNKTKFDYTNSRKELTHALKEKFSKKNLEYHYDYIEPRIICEELLEDEKGNIPNDYKFYCFRGYVKCVLVCSDRIDENNKSIFYYDTNWKELDYVKDSYYNSKKIEKPKNFNSMVRIASELSKDHDFVRVDLYNIDGKIYFGELTFTPACGMIYNLKQSALDELGDLLILNK